MDNNDEKVSVFYELADGRCILIDVSIDIKEALDDAKRQDCNQGQQDRRNGVTFYPTDYMDMTIASPQSGIASLLAVADEYARLDAAVARLPIKQRRRLLLRFKKGMSYKKIAEMEHVTINTAYRTVRKALHRLRAMI